MVARPLLLIPALVLLGLTLSACGPQRATRQPCPAGARCLEYGNAADPISLDPQIATAVNEAAILRELFDGLYTDADDGTPRPGVARSAETSADGLVWTLHLRPETWSDGVPLTANDFVFAYQHMLDPKTGSSYAYLLYVLKNAQAVNDGKAPLSAVGAKALDDETLQLTLEHPAPFLPQLLKHQAFYPIPEHAVRRLGANWSKPGRMVSNGPYTLVEWSLGDHIRIQKNPLYRGDAKVCFDDVDFFPTQDPTTAERRVERGELDINAGIQSNKVASLRADPTKAPFVHTHPYLSLTYLIFNRRDVPSLKDVRVRQAISMAIDRKFMTDKLLRAGQLPTTSFVPPGIAGYLPPGAARPKPYWGDWTLARRQAEARRLLAAAGYGPGRPLKLTFKTFTTPTSLMLAESLMSDLKSVGVGISLQQEDGIVALQSFEIRDFQLGAAGWIADYNDPMTYLALMRSDTGAQNYGDYKNPAYDALLDKADNEPDALVRAGYMARAEQMMLDDADVAPLVVGVNLNLVNPHITGWVDNDSDIHPIRDLCRNDAAPGGTNRPR
jgi:oligopeptide transport system substrate-binding protein